MKDHEIRETVSRVQELCFQFRDSQQLRERIANVLVPVLKAAIAPSDAAQAPLTVAQRDSIWVAAEALEKADQHAHAAELRAMLAAPVAPQAAGDAAQARDAARYRLIRAGFGDFGPDADLHNAFVDGGDNLDAALDKLLPAAAPVPPAAAAPLTDAQIAALTDKWARKWSASSAWNTRRCIDNALREARAILAAHPTVAADAAAPSRPETTSEHIARDIREGRFPERSEPQMVAVAQPDERAAFDLEAMLQACVPGGSICDPQVIADSLREWFAGHVTAPQATKGDEPVAYTCDAGMKLLRDGTSDASVWSKDHAQPGDTKLYLRPIARAAVPQAEQRMSDAERRKLHWNPIYNTDPVQRACGELPVGWEIAIALEKDAGCIDIIDPDGERIQIDNDGDCWNWYVHAAIDEVFDRAARKGASQ